VGFSYANYPSSRTSSIGMRRTVTRAAILLGALAGVDGDDAATEQLRPPHFLAAAKSSA
jgi:hypothetical protein